MKKELLHAALIAVAAWALPSAAFAVGAPPLPDAPFFGWLAVPVVAVAGRKLLKRKKGGDSGRL